MWVIHKYIVNDLKIKIKIPQFAKILSFQSRMHTFSLWAMVNLNNQMVYRNFQIVSDDEEISYSIRHGGMYVGTAQNGYSAFHLFDLGESSIEE